MIVGHGPRLFLGRDLRVRVVVVDVSVVVRGGFRHGVENRTDGTTIVQGKVWPTGQPEPAAWTIQKTDTIPHRKGAPGLYGDGISDVSFDNVRIYRNGEKPK